VVEAASAATEVDEAALVEDSLQEEAVEVV
jgi:hypothetical protein